MNTMAISSSWAILFQDFFFFMLKLAISSMLDL